MLVTTNNRTLDGNLEMQAVPYERPSDQAQLGGKTDNVVETDVENNQEPGAENNYEEDDNENQNRSNKYRMARTASYWDVQALGICIAIANIAWSDWRVALVEGFWAMF